MNKDSQPIPCSWYVRKIISSHSTMTRSISHDHTYIKNAILSLKRDLQHIYSAYYVKKLISSHRTETCSISHAHDMWKKSYPIIGKKTCSISHDHNMLKKCQTFIERRLAAYPMIITCMKYDILSSNEDLQHLLCSWYVTKTHFLQLNKDWQHVNSAWYV